jgi:hypothetical protein
VRGGRARTVPVEIVDAAAAENAWRARGRRIAWRSRDRAADTGTAAQFGLAGRRGPDGRAGTSRALRVRVRPEPREPSGCGSRA